MTNINLATAISFFTLDDLIDDVINFLRFLTVPGMFYTLIN